MIPLCDLTLQYRNLKTEIDAAMQKVAEQARYILGPNVKAFESELADFTGAEFAAGVGSGTDALHLALRALGIGPGDEVITTPFTFIATTEAISIVGARPVFCDIDPRTFNLDTTAIESLVTPRTRAIMPVHLYGQPCNMDLIADIAARHGLAVIEDCAQAIGATYRGRQVGTFGEAGCFSFFPSKNLGAMGDGGMVISSEKSVYSRVEMLRRHGGRIKYHHSEIGLNSRLDELQAAILRIKLKHLAEWCDARRQNAVRYNRMFDGVDGVQCPREFSPEHARILDPSEISASAETRSVYHQYTIMVEHRDVVMQALKEHEIGSLVYYPVPLHLQEVHADLGYRRGDLPHAEFAAEHCMSLPMFPELAESQQARVVQVVSDAVRQASSIRSAA